MYTNEINNLAHNIDNKTIKLMLINTKEKCNDWKAVSSGNKSFTKGCAWNILVKGISFQKPLSYLHKKNLIREFWEYLPTEIIEEIKNNRPRPLDTKPVHHPPNFDYLNNTK